MSGDHKHLFKSHKKSNILVHSCLFCHENHFFNEIAGPATKMDTDQSYKIGTVKKDKQNVRKITLNNHFNSSLSKFFSTIGRQFTLGLLYKFGI